jgi:hypothetical protein
MSLLTCNFFVFWKKRKFFGIFSWFILINFMHPKSAHLLSPNSPNFQCRISEILVENRFLTRWHFFVNTKFFLFQRSKIAVDAIFKLFTHFPTHPRRSRRRQIKIQNMWTERLLQVGYLGWLLALNFEFRRHREGAARPEYSVIPDSVHFNDTALLGKLKSTENELEFAIITLRESTIRIFVDESGPRLRDRFIPYQSLDGFPVQVK